MYGNGEGNGRQRKDGRYETRYCIETPDGLKRRSVYGKTRKEAAEKLAEAVANKDDIPAFEPTGITMREFFAEYEEAIRYTIERRSFDYTSEIAHPRASYASATSYESTRPSQTTLHP